MKKKIKSIIILCIIVLVVLVYFLVFKFHYFELQKIKNINVLDKMNDNIMLPEYFNVVISEYKGNLTTEIIGKTYNNYAEKVIPKYYKKCKNIPEEKLEKFFKKNKDIIYIELKYEDYQDFKNFINIISKLKGDSLKLESYKILENTVKKSGNNLCAYIGIKYNNNEEIHFNSIVYRNISNDSKSIKLQTDVDSEKIKLNEEILNERQKESQNHVSPYTRRISYKIIF